MEKECNGVIFSKRSEFRKDFGCLEEINDQYGKNKRSESMNFDTKAKEFNIPLSVIPEPVSLILN